MESKTRGRELGRYASSKRNGSSIPRPRGASHYGVKINTFIPASYVVDSLSLCPTAVAMAVENYMHSTTCSLWPFLPELHSLLLLLAGD